MKVLVLSGSIGKKSCTRALLKHLERLIKKRDVDTVFWDLGEKPLPIAVPEYYLKPEANPNKRVGEFVEAVKSADAFIFGTPLYHGSFSGVWKNAMDNLPPAALDHKPVSLVSHSSNARTCVKPCYDMRPIVVSLCGYPTLSQIGSTDGDFIYDEKMDDFKLVDEGGLKRSEELVAELLENAALFSQKKSQKSQPRDFRAS